MFRGQPSGPAILLILDSDTLLRKDRVVESVARLAMPLSHLAHPVVVTVLIQEGDEYSLLTLLRQDVLLTASSDLPPFLLHTTVLHLDTILLSAVMTRTYL